MIYNKGPCGITHDGDNDTFPQMQCPGNIIVIK